GHASIRVRHSYRLPAAVRFVEHADRQIWRRRHRAHRRQYAGSLAAVTSAATMRNPIIGSKNPATKVATSFFTPEPSTRLTTGRASIPTAAAIALFLRFG